MKKIKYIVVLIVLLCLFYNEGNSQIRKGTYLTSIEYSTAFNVGRANEFASTPGWAGAALTIKGFVSKNTALGMTFGYNIFGQEETDGTIELENGTISGAQGRYINYLPIYANLSYYFVKDRRSKFMPYIQANIGTIHVWQRLQLGVYVRDNDTWHFGMGPEVGFVTALGNSAAFTMNAKYNYALSSGETLAGKDGNNYSFFNINIGFAYMR